MLKDQQVSQMFTMLRQECSVANTARKLTVSRKSVRKYRDKNVLPSQIDHPARIYRTRVDPLERFWPEVEQLLQNDHRMKDEGEPEGPLRQMLCWASSPYNLAPRQRRLET